MVSARAPADGTAVAVGEPQFDDVFDASLACAACTFLHSPCAACARPAAPLLAASAAAACANVSFFAAQATRASAGGEEAAQLFGAPPVFRSVRRFGDDVVRILHA
jgi:hypothetical protein